MTTSTLANPLRHRRALTLIELLGALVLLSLILSTMAATLNVMSAGARLGEAEAALANADRTCRQLSSVEGPVTLQLGGGGASFLIVSRSGTTPFSRRSLPSGVTGSLELVSEPGGSTSLVFDRSGRCSDYRVTVAAGGMGRAWRVSGITGWRTAEETP